MDPFNSPTFGNALLLRVDGDIGAMSLAPNGRDALLAGRRGLLVIDMDDPFTTPRLLPHVTSWEVADVQWLPHHSIKPLWCILTSNQKALLWDLAKPGASAVVNVLHSHTRAITDINFHPLNPEILATCLIDSYVFSWDMRTPRKPVAQWAQWRSGCTQIKWNHHNPHQIASAHDHSLYVWDSRKHALPILKIHKAHAGKINGIDFKDGLRNLISCSNDRAVKMWNLEDYSLSPLTPTVTIETDFPVCRARLLPFGSDHACGIMPLRGGNNAVTIVNYDMQLAQAQENDEKHITISAAENSVYSFEGHDGPIKDFLWRTRRQNYEGFESKTNWDDYQLVTWLSHDYDLRLWPHDDALFKSVSHSPDNQQLLSALRVPYIERLLPSPLPRDFSDASVQSLLSADKSHITSGTGTPKVPPYVYRTYCHEPLVLVDEYRRRNHGDLLLSLVSYSIANRIRDLGLSLLNTSNELKWISGVRLGAHSSSMQPSELPNNLGEEVSVVGHRFPKVHFEKISVSTGKLVISLNGLVSPVLDSDSARALSLAEDLALRKALDSLQSADTQPIKDHSEVTNPSASVVNAGGLAAATNTSSITTNAPNSTNNIPAQPVAFPLAKFKETTIPSTTGRHTSGGTAILGRPSASDLPGAPDSAMAIRRARASSIGDSVASTVDEHAAESKIVFIRVGVKFPAQYPYLDDFALQKGKGSRRLLHRTVQFDLEETHELSRAHCFEMTRRLHEISYFYANKYQQFCLEPCLRYLLGEKVHLDDGAMREALLSAKGETFEVGNEDWADDLIFQQPDYTNLNRRSTMSSDEDALDDDDDLLLLASKEETPGIVYSDKFDSTPVPKGCGAMWAPNGRLVCFFIPRNNQAEKSVNQEKFNIFSFTDSGFTVKTNSAHPKVYEESDLAVYLIDLLDENEGSDGGPNVSDNDDTSSLDESFSDESFRNDWKELVQDEVVSNHISGEILGTWLGISNKYNKHAASAHGGDTLGTKSSLRKSKLGERAKLKARNLVGIFDFSHLIPDKVELAREYRVLGAAPDELARHNGNVAAKFGLYEVAETWRILEMVLIKDVLANDYNTVTSRFFWGTHPFGNRELVPQIFDFYERRGNVQMLAVMSCVLFENKEAFSSAGIVRIPDNTPHRLPASLVGAAAQSISNEAHRGLFNGVYPMSYSRDLMAQLRSLSECSTPDHTSHPREVSSFRHQASRRGIRLAASPLPNNTNDRLLPFEKETSYKTQKNSSAFRAKGLHFGVTSLPIQADGYRKLRPASRLAGMTSRPIVRSIPQVQVQMQNTCELDILEHDYGQLLLSQLDHDKIKLYRAQYAEMLYIWNLPLNRIKVLKFNFAEKSQEASQEFAVHRCRYGIRRKARQASHIDYVSAITPIASSREQAWNLVLQATIKACVLCQLRVSKSVVACGQCEHVMHAACAATWWRGGTNECPSGCGCQCLA